jgi:asparagine synthase (glutamine-hydrolysing)
MSGIAGLINFDGAPVEPEAIRAMLDAQAYRGPDRRGVWASGPVGLGHDLLRTVPEAEQETQPFSLDQTVWITADGRLDNRDDLVRALRHTSPEPLEGVPDCHLMLLAYHHWGEDFATHLIGDFALAIWDGHSRRLLCACDALAIRSLYYTVNRNRFIFGSSIGAVLAALSEIPEPNEVFIAQFLTQTMLDGRTATFYEGIHRLAPCHMLIAESGQIRQTKYYEFGAGRLIRYDSDQEYVDHFRELLEQALIARLRSNTGVSIEVSGGLDSSSLAVLANHLVATGRFAPTRPLTAFCKITPDIPEMDERVYQDSVVETCNHLEVDYFNNEAFWGLQHLGSDDGYPFHQPEPHAMRALVLGAAGRSRERGDRVILSGIGSDTVNGQINGYSLEGPLRDLSWRDRAAEWPSFRRYYSARSIFFHGLVRPMLRPLVHGRLRRTRYARQARQQFPYLHPQWLARTYRQYASDQPAFEPKLPTRATRIGYRWLMNGRVCIWRACADTSASFAQVEMRYPYLDRRLVDFMLQVPTHMLIRRGWDKHILREAIGDLLPNPARYLESNVDATKLIDRGLHDKEKDRLLELLSEPRMVERGWAHSDAWQKAWKQYWAGTTDRYFWLVAGINVEAWLRGDTQRIHS